MGLVVLFFNTLYLNPKITAPPQKKNPTSLSLDLFAPLTSLIFFILFFKNCKAILFIYFYFNFFIITFFFNTFILDLSWLYLMLFIISLKYSPSLSSVSV